MRTLIYFTSLNMLLIMSNRTLAQKYYVIPFGLYNFVPSIASKISWSNFCPEKDDKHCTTSEVVISSNGFLSHSKIHQHPNYNIN